MISLIQFAAIEIRWFLKKWLSKGWKIQPFLEEILSFQNNIAALNVTLHNVDASFSYEFQSDFHPGDSDKGNRHTKKMVDKKFKVDTY